MHAGLLHAGVAHVSDERCGGAWSFDVREDRVALGAHRQGQERGAHVRRDASDDDLAAVCSPDSGAEVSIIPSVDFALAFNKGGFGVHL